MNLVRGVALAGAILAIACEEKSHQCPPCPTCAPIPAAPTASSFSPIPLPIRVRNTCDQLVSADDPIVANLSFSVLMQVDISKNKNAMQAAERFGGLTIPTLFTIRCWMQTGECEGSYMHLGNVVAGREISDIDLVALQGLRLAERTPERVIISDKKKERVFIVNRVDRKVTYSHKFSDIADEFAKADCDKASD